MTSRRRRRAQSLDAAWLFAKDLERAKYLTAGGPVVRIVVIVQEPEEAPVIDGWDPIPECLK